MSDTTALTRPSGAGELEIKPANKLRGKPFHDHAVAFSDVFAIGDALTPEKFDQWAHSKGFLNVPFDAPKKSDVWLAHLQRRHQLHHGINKAAMHPRMRDEQRQPFSIVFAGPNLWEVRSIVHALEQDDTAKRLERLAIIQRRKLLYLQQSEDFTQLPPYLRMAVKDLSDDIDSTLQRVKLEAQDLDRRVDRIADRVKASVADGEVRSVNHGIPNLLSDGADTE